VPLGIGSLCEGRRRNSDQRSSESKRCEFHGNLRAADFLRELPASASIKLPLLTVR
jgi:hypothetical protein